jgi:hypothetical protein
MSIFSAGTARAWHLALDQAGSLTALAVQSAGTRVYLIIDVNGYFE